MVDVFSELPKYLDYFWTAACIHQSQASLWGKRVWAGWKPIAIFTNGEPGDHEWFNDKLSSNSNATKDYHEWSQPLEQAKQLIEIFCPVGGRVFDPMCGAGTVPIAAFLLDREAYGCDVDPAAIDSAKVRLQELLNERSRIDEDATAQAICEPVAANDDDDTYCFDELLDS